MDEFQELLKDIWKSKWITNNGKYHKALEQALAEYLILNYISQEKRVKIRFLKNDRNIFKTMKKQKLLIIVKDQLGNLTDALKWCEYLRTTYSITYVGYNMGYEKPPNMEDVKERYVSAKLPKLLRGSFFILYALLHVLFSKGKIMVVYFPQCELLKKLIPWKKILLDIRSLRVSSDKSKREQYDAKVKKACGYFDKVSVISQGVADKLSLKQAHILPLGSDCISDSIKHYSDALRLIYVGTFEMRNIEKTIEGVALFHQKYPNIKISYKIIGDGRFSETSSLKEIINQYFLKKIVTIEGRIPHYELQKYFDEANIGVSFVPITEYYQYQPPTKTFEYLMSGLFCIATNTAANSEILTDNNGILINDNANEFANALEMYWTIKESLIQQDIKNSVSEFTWSNIVETKLKPILNLI